METFASSTLNCISTYKKTTIGFIALVGGLLAIYYGFGVSAEEGLYGLVLAIFVIFFWCLVLRRKLFKSAKEARFARAHYYFQYKTLFNATIWIILVQPLAFVVYFMNLGWSPSRVWCVSLIPLVLYFLYVLFSLTRAWSKAIDGMFPTSKIREKFVEETYIRGH